MCFKINLCVVCSLPWGPRVLAGKRLPRMKEILGSNPSEGKFFSQFTSFYEVGCEKLFCKILILKYKNFDKLKTKIYIFIFINNFY